MRKFLCHHQSNSGIHLCLYRQRTRTKDHRLLSPCQTFSVFLNSPQSSSETHLLALSSASSCLRYFLSRECLVILVMQFHPSNLSPSMFTRVCLTSWRSMQRYQLLQEGLTSCCQETLRPSPQNFQTRLIESLQINQLLSVGSPIGALKIIQTHKSTNAPSKALFRRRAPLSKIHDLALQVQPLLTRIISGRIRRCARAQAILCYHLLEHLVPSLQSAVATKRMIRNP
jgi:hypothetical protein